MQVNPDGFDNSRAFKIAGPQALLQRHQQMHAVGDDDHQHDGRRRGRRRRERQADPSAHPHRHEDGENHDQPGRRDARKSSGQEDKDHGHDRKAGGQEDFLAVDRRLRKGVVDDYRSNNADVDARKPLFRLGGELAGEPGNFGNSDRLIFFRQFDGDVDCTDAAVPRQEAALEPRVGEGCGTDPRPFPRIA